MNEDISPKFQYNSCSSKGICSVSPRTSALQNVLVFYLNICAKYCLKLYDIESFDNEIKNYILNTVAMCVSNPEFNETSFLSAFNQLKIILTRLNSVYTERFPHFEKIYNPKAFEECEDIVELIKFGENISKKASSRLSTKVRDLYKIMLIVAKSLCINLLDLNSYEVDTSKEFFDILELLSEINLKEKVCDDLVKVIKNVSQTDINTMKKLHMAQEKRYGIQSIGNVSYTTTPAKAVLVVGSNIRELETIIEALSKSNIDIYTHDEMLLAHTFPKFKTYKRLKGQYGHGLENCLIDFATFPGPIILTKHSLHNVENFYRGLLYTTEQYSYKGVISIKNNDYSAIIKSATETKGFKTGRICETVTIGYDFAEVKKQILDKLDSKKYNKIIIIGLKEYDDENKNYFENLIKTADKDTLIISFSYNKPLDNLIFINACYDSYSLIRLFEIIKSHKIKKLVFMPKCNKKTISEMIYLKCHEDTKVFVGECSPIMINPTLRKTLEECFNIETISSEKTIF